MQKRNFINGLLVICSLSLFCFGCSKKGSNDVLDGGGDTGGSGMAGDQARLAITSPADKAFDLGLGKAEGLKFSVSSNVDWQAVSQADWIRIDTKDGHQDQDVIFHVDANSGEGRMDSIVVTAVGDADVKDVLIVKQSRTVAVGDFFLSDGMTVSKDSVLSADRQKQVIGIVFSVDTARIGAKAKEKLEGRAHGLVLALKDVGRQAQWKSEGTDAGLPPMPTLGDAYGDVDGYGNTLFVKSLNDYSEATYPAFAAADGYNQTVPAPSGTTGWYLPSMGEWFDVLQNLGGIDLSAYQAGGSEATKYYAFIPASQTASAISSRLKMVGEGNYDKIDSAEWPNFWSSTEGADTGARYVAFSGDGHLYLSYIYPTYIDQYFRVRCVLAF